MKFYVISGVNRYTSLLRPMPTAPVAACEWLLPKLTSALTDCKIFPIRMQHLKHQEVLRNSYELSFCMHDVFLHYDTHLRVVLGYQMLPATYSASGNTLGQHASELETSYHQIVDLAKQDVTRRTNKTINIYRTQHREF